MAAVADATRAYEAWMRKRIDVVGADLRHKHKAMAESAFSFMRATFYRWVPLWQEACPDLAKTPKLLAVGDLHVENFGTWPDAEGRLVWGINDFDECYPMPYAIDLVRVAASAVLAIREERLRMSADDACAALLEGYAETVRSGEGRAFVLEEEHPALRSMALGEARNPQLFWAKINSNKAADAPGVVRKLIRKHLPHAQGKIRIVHRTAGLGSLGRPRFVGIAQSHGGMVAREAKAMLPSAFAWANKGKEEQFFVDTLLERAVRCPDPFLTTKKGWVLRRIGPLCSAIELADFPKTRDEQRILKAMGHETANIHLATPSALPAVRRDLTRRGRRWLREAAGTMAEATLADWKAWRKAQR
jgi:hypothetical protein